MSCEVKLTGEVLEGEMIPKLFYTLSNVIYLIWFGNSSQSLF